MSDQNDLKIDFDRIAELEQNKWNHNNHYYNFLLRKIGKSRGDSLEIGCGTGEFCKLLALKSDRVTGIDLSPKMIEKAKKNISVPNISFINADITDCDYEKESFDCIVSIATMHHLPYKAVLENAKGWLKSGGIILILDLYKSDTPVDYLYSLIASPFNVLMCLIKNKRIRQTPEEVEYWKEHSKHDKFMTIKEIKSIADEVLPGVKVKRRLFWRYSLVWHNTKCQ